MRSRASKFLLACSWLISVSLSSISSFTLSLCRTGATSYPPSLSPAKRARFALLRSSRSINFFLFSWRFCLSVLGIIAKTASAVIASSFIFLPDKTLLGFLLPLAFSGVDGPHSSRSPSPASSSSDSKSISSAFTFATDKRGSRAVWASDPTSSKTVLLNQRAVLTEEGSEGSMRMRGFLLVLTVLKVGGIRAGEFPSFPDRRALCSSSDNGAE
mmetsp:Transcript_17944/g.39827  ORF Transcript_17944/g.39827 Transcript_17944/m.39827 type:complete len:214 (+) Transcript_17944:177-818(+)